MTVIANDRLPRSEGGSREFVGDDHGVEGVSFILVEAAPGRGPSLHRHAYAEICIVQEGQALYTLGDEQIEARAGEVVVVPPGVPHAFVNTGDGPLRQVDIHASSRFVTEWLDGRTQV